MANKMLIDAAHPEETRVVVLRGQRVEEFDFESANKKQLRGNIYLAKVTRVEPSLQAAFIDYGGNRHGFLAFSEIHPDYYQIPVSDRQALIDAEAAEAHEEEEERRPRRSRRRRGGERHAARRRSDEAVRESADGESHDEAHDGEAHDEGRAHDEHASEHSRPVERAAEDKPPYDDPTPELIAHASSVHADAAPDDAAPESPRSETPAPAEAALPLDPTQPAAASDAVVDTGSTDAPGETRASEHAHDDEEGEDEDGEDEDDHDEEDDVEHIGGDAMEEVPTRAYRPRRQYKIQEVIKRRQILLVQVVKEERGNKGAALTTYLSLAGRYSVLMPNTARGGGISRKITDAGDRQRLKSIAQELEVPEGMGVILRTAGASRTKPEVKRDFEYLMRMWETVRETTMQSTAPTLVYEEGSLIKRAIRDLYNKDVEEVVVSGEEGYREAKDFMRLLMPSHAKNVQPWRDAQPIFTKAGAEAQLDAMFSNRVTLKSGGYIVINQTEALVAIDVNSGRSTREHNIEDTALRTNLEAADEVARQLRLRDLAGLIVVDFIDMEENRNNRAVERRMKDALKNDRARIQIGRISHFGLLEMSRQRIRTGVLEGSTVMCECCAGSGMVRSTASIALHVLRLLEDALISDASRNIVVRTRGAVALYILNHKRAHLSDLEARFGAAVAFESDEDLTGTTYCAIERTEPATGVPQPSLRRIPIEEPEPEVEEPSEDSEDETTDEAAGSGAPRHEGDGEDEPRRRRRRRRGRGRDRESSGISEDAPQPADDALGFIADNEGQRTAATESDEDESDEDDGEQSEDGSQEERGGRRRRSRRGGRRAREARERLARRDGSPHDENGSDDAEPTAEVTAPVAQAPESADVVADAEAPATAAEAEKPALEPVTPETTANAVTEPVAAEPISPEPVTTTSAVSVEPAASDATPETTAAETAAAEARAKRPEPVSSEPDPSRPKRSGWWQRAKATLGG